LRLSWWTNGIALILLTLFLAMPALADGMPDTDAAFTDYGSFLGEYQAAGAFKFYDNTEAYLRMAQFELALMRYRFLKGHIQRKGDYHGLKEMVDLRLRFLKKQMHLTNTDIAAIPPRKARIPKAKKPEAKPPEKPAAAKPKKPGDDDTEKEKAEKEPSPPSTPPVVVIPGAPRKAGAAPTVTPGAAPTTAPAAAPPGTPPAVSPAGTAKPPDVVVTDTPKTKEEKAEEEKEDKPPPLPPTFWEKVKIRLHLKKKSPDSG